MRTWSRAPPIIDDGQLHRIHVEGDKRGTLNGAYILHSDGKPSGWAYYFPKDLTVRWSLSGKREQIEADRKQRQIEMQQRHEQAAKKAQSIWRNAQPVSNHPYLTQNKIQAHNARCSHSALVIHAMFDFF